MDAEQIRNLVARFNAGEASPEEANLVEKLIESGKISLNDLGVFRSLDEQLMSMEVPSPSLQLDDKFYDMLARERSTQTTTSFNWKNFFSLPELLPRLSFAVVALIIGLAGGYFLRSPKPIDGQMNVLTQQVSDLQEMVMLSLLEKESASDRLKAVSLSQEMDQASQKVTTALLQTLNHDSNVNVRLAALDALKPYVRESHVRQELIRSIAKQESPLVQIAMAELMAQLQEKSSVQELQKILENERLPSDVKKKIKQSIDVLI